MDIFFENPGLSHIGREIFRSLDFKSQASFRLVCKSWKNHVDNLASKISFKDLEQLLEKFTKARSVSRHDKEEWKKFFVSIFKETKSIPFIKSYLKHVFSRESQIKYVNDKTPLLEFVNYGNIKMVKFNNYLDKVYKDHKGLYHRCKTPINRPNDSREKAISLAIQSGNLKMVKAMEISDNEQFAAIQKYPIHCDTPDKLKMCVDTIYEMVRKFVKFHNMKRIF